MRAGCLVQTEPVGAEGEGRVAGPEGHESFVSGQVMGAWG